MAEVGFVHLRVHSAYSLLEGALPLGKVIDLAAADRQPALAVTDTGNLFGALEFSEKAAKAGLQPIIGCSVAIDFGDRQGNEPATKATPLPRICLLAATEAGYGNLVDLVSRSWLMSDGAGEAQIQIDDMDGRADGIIALTGGPDGPIDMSLAIGEQKQAEARLRALADLFPGSLYVELQRHDRPAEIATEPMLLDLAYALDLPLVATNQAYFPTRDDFEAHDALICISEGKVIAEDERRHLTPEHYFKSRDEMAAFIRGSAGGAQ